LVIERLSSLSNTTTTIVVASRPTTVKIADQVLFVHQGKVHELATHEALMSSNQAYANLMKSFEMDRKAS
jgi:ATP-binding cassette subfamily B protein